MKFFFIVYLLFIPKTFANAITDRIVELTPHVSPNHGTTVPTKFTTELNFALFPNTEWTEEQVQKHVDAATKVFRQCGLEITKATIHYVNNVHIPKEIVLYDPNSEDSILKLVVKAANLPHPLIFLVNDFLERPHYPFSRAIFRVNIPAVPPELANTLWFPTYVNSQKYADEIQASPYSVMAHELAHIFTLDGQHNGNNPGNLLTIRQWRTNLLLAEHCSEIAESAFVKPVVAK